MGRRSYRPASPKTAEDNSTLGNLVHEGLNRLAQGIAIFDSELRLVHANKRLVDMFEFPPELVESGTPFTDIIRFNAERGDYGPGDVEEIVRERVERVRNFEPNLFEYVGADGTVIEVRREPLPDGGFVSTLTDITERKRAEEEFRKAHDELEFRVQERTEHLEHEIGERQFAEAALRESEERFRAGFEHAAAGITTVDRDRRFLSVNPAFCEMLGYTEEELVAIERTDLTHPDDRAITEVYLRRLWKGEIGNIRWEKRFLHKDGHVVWADAVISMVRDAQGEPLYTFGQIQDITERKRAEEELRMAMKAAEDANQAKSQFLTSMSHELRTPLNAVLGFGQLLKSGTKAPLNDTQRSHVDHILDGGEHLLNLINQVLDLSKIETGAIPVSIEDVEVADIFEECLVLIEPLTEKYDARVVVEGAKHETTTVRADYTRLKQVMLNLLSNAVKYNRSGGMAILECAKGGRGMARLSVSDTGPGIAKDKQEQLFKPFSRLGAELSNIEGTGVGLILTKQLVELMGGHIGFESEEGKGSTFWIEIPRAKGNRREKPPRKPRKPRQRACA